MPVGHHREIGRCIRKVTLGPSRIEARTGHETTRAEYAGRRSRKVQAASESWTRAHRTDQGAAGSRTGEPGMNERCTVPVMTRTAARVFASGALLAVTLAAAGAVRASGDVVVAVSPTSVAVGQPVEVLVRTFRVVDRADLSLPFESPLQPYPVASGAWNILYHWPDYPFDVVAQHEDGTEVPLTLARDPTDATLWRGVVSLPKAGTWTVWVRNNQQKGPGSTSVVTVRAGPTAATASLAPINPTTTTTGATPIEAGPAAIVGTLVGLVVGAVIARGWKRRPTL